MLPAASMTYLAYSGIKKPIATLRAAVKAVGSVAQLLKGEQQLSSPDGYDRQRLALTVAAHLATLPEEEAAHWEALFIAALARTGNADVAYTLASQAAQDFTLAAPGNDPWETYQGKTGIRKGEWGWKNKDTGEIRWGPHPVTKQHAAVAAKTGAPKPAPVPQKLPPGQTVRPPPPVIPPKAD